MAAVESSLENSYVRSLLRDEIQMLRARVEALIKWTEEFEEGTIFAKPELKNGTDKKAGSKKDDRSPSPKELDSQSASPSSPEKSESDGGSPDKAIMEGDTDLFGASPDFSQATDPWNEKKAEAAEEEAPNKVSLLFLD